MSNYSDGNGFDEILQRMLATIPDTFDKRQGSIIYDALAPAASELAQCYIALDVYTDQTYLSNAVGSNLDNKAADYGLSRKAATYARRVGTFTNTSGTALNVAINTRFSIPNSDGGYNFKVIYKITDGQFLLECETAGTVGNQYFGSLLPLTPINNLGTATLGTVNTAGQDTETDSALRSRIMDKLNETPFGGNIAAYRQFVKSINGIGDCLVIPVWNGGGTVKLVPVTSSYDIPSSSKIAEIKTAVDPTDHTGNGYGTAPIGHNVTVVAPTKLELTIECDITLDSEHTIQSIQSEVEEALETYILSVEKDWATSTTVTIYISKCLAAILSIDGIIDAENLTINDSSNNITITPATSPHQYPMFKEVILSESQ